MINNEFEIFKDLNDELSKENLELTIICVGGFVLNHYGIRATVDVDGFYKSSKKINSIIKKIGDKYSINSNQELWLNNSVQNMNPWPSEKICEVIYKFSNLTVMMPPLKYIAGMKLISARQQDIQDVASIIKKEKIKNPESLEKELLKFGFNSIDESLLLDAFGMAYGIDWLEKYYIENEEKILKKIKDSIK